MSGWKYNPLAPIAVAEAPVSLSSLQKAIQSSSNFRFASQFFTIGGRSKADSETARALLSSVIEAPDLQAFLRDSFAPVTNETFSIEPLHEHALLARADSEFEQTLANAAADRLGAYSRNLSDAGNEQVQAIRQLFASLGPYSAFELVPGTAAGCPTCKHHNGHLFSSWFYGVAWDWCFCLIWPASSLAWLGCLTDTD